MGPFINYDLGGRQIRRMNAADFSVPPYENTLKIWVPPPPQQVTQNRVFMQLF